MYSICSNFSATYTTILALCHFLELKMLIKENVKTCFGHCLVLRYLGLKIGQQNFIFEMTLSMWKIFGGRCSPSKIRTFPREFRYLPCLVFELEAFAWSSYPFFLSLTKDLWAKLMADSETTWKIKVGLWSALFLILLMSAVICDQNIWTRKSQANISKSTKALSMINTILESSWRSLQKAAKKMTLKFSPIFQRSLIYMVPFVFIPHWLNTAAIFLYKTTSGLFRMYSIFREVLAPWIRSLWRWPKMFIYVLYFQRTVSYCIYQ